MLAALGPRSRFDLCLIIILQADLCPPGLSVTFEDSPGLSVTFLGLPTEVENYLFRTPSEVERYLFRAPSNVDLRTYFQVVPYTNHRSQLASRYRVPPNILLIGVQTCPEYHA